jgi:hypothetical protein
MNVFHGIPPGNLQKERNFGAGIKECASGKEGVNFETIVILKSKANYSLALNQ